MTLRPIPGAPSDAPIPDFPTVEPGPLVVPESRFTRRPAESLPMVPPLPSVRRPGPVEIRGAGDSTLIFRCIPEIPAINRSSMTISIIGEPMEDYSRSKMPHLDLATDKAKAFLQALRDGSSPIAVTDGGTGFQVEFAIAEDGPVFIVSKRGHDHISRRFKVGWTDDVKTLADHLLTDLGP